MTGTPQPSNSFHMPKVKTQPFEYARKQLPNDNILYIVRIREISPILKSFIDEKIGKICDGKGPHDLAIIKRRLLKFLNDKKNSTLETGAIAEFFVHLFLNSRRLQPQFIFFNLEEGSVKKGFDGYYISDGEDWICESKSGHYKAPKITHVGKVKEAYMDLHTKLSGKTSNNSWRNAYRHAIQVGGKKGLQKKMRALSDEYDQGQYHKIDDFNIIPCGTVFLSGKWQHFDGDVITQEVKTAISKFRFKKIRIICLTKISKQIFLDYLNS